MYKLLKILDEISAICSEQLKMHSKLFNSNASNKSCLKLNFLQKTQWMHVSISPMSGARRRQISASFNINTKDVSKVRPYISQLLN